MKKVYFFTAIILAISLLSTCTIPTAVEIQGTPHLRFSAGMDFSEMFSDIMTESFPDDAKVVACENTTYQTYIIHMNLFGEDGNEIGVNLNTETAGFPIPDGINIETTDTKTISDSDGDVSPPEPISLEGFTENLKGFKFKKVLSRLYISGSPIVEQLRIKMKFGTDEHTLDMENQGFEFHESGFNEEKWKKEFTAFANLPSHGEEIDFTGLIGAGNDIEIKYEVILPSGRTFPASWVTAGASANIKAELVVWFVLELEAGSGGADLSLDEFMGDDPNSDLFGRDSADEEGSMTQYFESIKLGIELSQEAFKGAEIILASNSGAKLLEVKNKISGKVLEFGFDEATMKKINDPAYFPFAPNFKIHWDQGGELKIPRDFKANYLSLEAKIKYRIEQ